MRFVNGTVYALDRNGSVTSGLACSNGRVTAVGPAAELPRGDEFDLRGRTVLPGLIDAHTHLRNLAESRLAVDLTGAGSEAEAAARVAERAATRATGSWISGRGWDETRWPGAVAPRRATLDGAAAANPVALTRVDGHALWVNGAALQAAQIDDETPDPPGGRIVRDAAGRATGLLIDHAARLVRDCIPEVDDAALAAAVAEAVQSCLSVGLTGVHEMGVDQRTIATYRRLIDDGRFPFRVRAAINGPGRTWQEWRERGPERYYGDRLSVAAIKLYADGALGSRGAALLTPYSDDPQNAGLELASGADLERWTRDAMAAGFQVCIHAIGDRANRTVLDAYQLVLAAPPVRSNNSTRLPASPDDGPRLRVEHAQILAPDDVPRFRALGVIPSMQPTHCTSDMAWAETRLGPQRCDYAYAWRSLVDSGVVVAGGSDFPVESTNPMLGISAAVTRRPPGAAGEPWHPEQRLTRVEAVRAFTSWAAYAGFDEAVAGSLEPGKYADFVVLDRDVFTCPEEEIAATRVLLTVVGGEAVYSDESAW